MLEWFTGRDYPRARYCDVCDDRPVMKLTHYRETRRCLCERHGREYAVRTGTPFPEGEWA